MAATDCLQLLNRCDQLCDGFLQPCYHILTVLEGSLLESQETLKFHNTSLEEKMIFQMTINLIVCYLPLFGEDTVVPHYCLRYLICCHQGFLMTLLSVCLNPSNLCPMGIPLLFCIIHLREKTLVGLPKGLMSVSLTLDSNFNIQGRKQRAMAVP